MKQIPLKGKYGEGKFALVDDSDYEYLNQFNWHIHKKPKTSYVRRNKKLENGRMSGIEMHREIMKPSKGLLVDHINHNGLDNRKSNLRTCTHSQSLANRSFGGKSKYKGVYYTKTGWSTQITHNKKNNYLGIFKNEVEAAKCYDEAAKRLHGKFANLNFKD